jgi:hypothetical protein
MLLTLKMTRGQVIILIILLILWVVGVFLAGFFGYKFHDEQKKNTTNEVLFIAGVVIAVGTFIGVIIVIIKASRGKSKVKVEDMPVESAAPTSWESYASSLPGNNLPYQAASPVAMGASPYMSYGPPPLPPTMGAYPGQASMYQPSASAYPYPY